MTTIYKTQKIHVDVINSLFVGTQIFPHDAKCADRETQNISDSLIKGIILMDL